VFYLVHEIYNYEGKGSNGHALGWESKGGVLEHRPEIWASFDKGLLKKI